VGDNEYFEELGQGGGNNRVVSMKHELGIDIDYAA
jgi:hypothetical protein